LNTTWRASPPLALVVDDNPRGRQVVSLYLAQLGLEAISVDNAREIVALACRYRPVVIVLDLMLPLTDGLVAIAYLRRQPETAQIPIVVISGHTNALSRGRAHMSEGGVIVVLRKPFTLGEVQAAVRQAIDPRAKDLPQGRASS
jgi:CheY-like chemotaxis protein